MSTMSAMSALIDPAITGLGLAANFAGIPGLGVAAGLLSSIQANCDRVVAHKEDCKRLADKACRLHSTLEEHRNRLKESELRKQADEVESTLRSINERTRRWASYRRLSAFFNDSKISDGIKQADSDLNAAITGFQVAAHIAAVTNQEELIAMVNNHHEDMRGLILRVLSNPDGPRQVAELERSGQHVALRVMEEGQMELRAIRERHVTFNVADNEGNPSPPSPQSDNTYLQYQRSLSQIHTLTGVPPAVKQLNGEVIRTGEIPVAGGTYSDVWYGVWMGDQKVALKALRGIRVTSPKAQKRFERELNVWSTLDHPNILKFLGIVTNIGHFIHMVSPWQENGCVPDYIKKNPDADRQHLLVGAAAGLAYLHGKGIVHGNVKGANILVSASGEPCICDFGMSKVVEDVTEQAASATLTKQGSVRWLAPELIEGDISSPTHACDIYSYGMTLFECISLEIPFAHIKRDAQVIHKLMLEKIKPDRPNGEDADRWLSDDLWELMLTCWEFEPDKRPLMSYVSQRMEEIEGDMSAKRNTPPVAG